MLQIVWSEQKKRKNILIWLTIFLFVAFLYMFFDYLAYRSYTVMFEDLGGFVFSVHMILNVSMALLTSLMLSLTQIKLNLTKVEPVGSNTIPVLSFIFALLTFGCTPCVVAFFAAVGIAFTPIVFPMGNLLWKVILLFFILASMGYILYSIDKGTCKAKLPNHQN
ncbi:MAG: hypothetical protein ACLFRI_05660 [Candidatus Izemoplasmataceae bacterium]